MFLKEVSYVHQGYIFIIKNTIKKLYCLVLLQFKMFSILLYFKVTFYSVDGKAELQQPLLKSKETFLLNHNTCFFLIKFR